MEAFMDILLPLEVWHWIALGLVLLGIELVLGTFDLLWVSAAAFATAVFKAIMPEALGGLEIQLLFFAVSAIGLLIVGRTVFGDWRNRESDKPLLNKRMETLIGKRALVTKTFSAGSGRVKIGDTEWLAHATHGEDFAEGTTVVIDGVDETIVKVVLA